MNTDPTETQSLACDLTAIPKSVREEHIATAPQLFQTAQEVRELSNGYSIRFLNESGKFMAVAKYIENERLCCPFFDFATGSPIQFRGALAPPDRRRRRKGTSVCHFVGK